MNDEEIDALIERVGRLNGSAGVALLEAEQRGASREHKLAQIAAVLFEQSRVHVRQQLADAEYARVMVDINGPVAFAGTRAELGRDLAEAMNRAPRSTEGGALASNGSAGSNRAALPDLPGAMPIEVRHRDLMRAAFDFAIKGEPEQARVCLDIAQYIDKGWLL